ncbi:WD repeat-containing 76 [Gossypium arboreum]|uniref:WD repeat-containing 76 n=2 Tax=Gossypium arboreum TaxID=29729 RepID=A0A0B0PF48_GOSAR|nr:uncharacterized protein LOC108486609 isoform X1 [Gossypium arboreum]KAK5825155.1 hypothetical protein PVK06_019960 [Gossypium arboreum]KHG23557.1 WD repeat-containing 76 [Gossypium arboreum]
MVSQKLTEYERKRLENIKRNAEMVAALNIRSKAAILSAATKRQKTKQVKKPKMVNPIVTRRSPRTRVKPPDSKGLSDKFLKPISMIDAFIGYEKESNQVLVDTILSIAEETQAGFPENEEFNGAKDVKDGNFSGFSEKGTLDSCKSEAFESLVKEEFDEHLDNKKSDPWLKSMDLKPENVAWPMPRRIMEVKFFPCTGIRMIAVGNKIGNIAFLNMDSEDEIDDGIYIYGPHTGAISGISVQRYSMSKIYSSGHDGFIRLMDAEKEVFDVVHYCDKTIHCLSQQPNDLWSLYFSEGRGVLIEWDVRTGKSSGNWMLHEDTINTISFNPQNPNIMATSSTDGTACIWDLRSTRSQKPKTMKTVSHGRAVNSAYFSPSGTSLATTSLDNNVGITSGFNYEDTSMIYHDNSTGTLNLSFRGIWGWDDSCIFIGNMRKGIDVISPVQRTSVMTLQSPQLPAIPWRFDAHPYEVGMLAAATNGSGVCLWTP